MSPYFKSCVLADEQVVFGSIMDVTLSNFSAPAH